MKTSSTEPDQCYCVGQEECFVIYDPEFEYDRINRPGPLFPDCPHIDNVASRASKKVNAGGQLKYVFGMHNKTDFANLLMSATDNAELVITLPPAFTVTGLKVSAGKEIVMTPIVDNSTTVGSFVWKLSNAGRLKTLKKLFFKFKISVDACALYGFATISASFFPYGGRDVYNCHYDSGATVNVIQHDMKCTNSLAGGGGGRKRGNEWGNV